MTTDREARRLLLSAWPMVFPSVRPTLAAIQAVQSVGREEVHYGDWWPGTNNWGAIQRGRADAGGNCPAGSVAHGDTHANGAPYHACFAVYSSPIQGARALIHTVFKSRGIDGRSRSETVLPAAMSGDQHAFDAALRASGYYELPLAQHETATRKNVAAMAAALGEDVALGSPEASGGAGKVVLWGALGVAAAATLRRLWWRRQGSV